MALQRCHIVFRQCFRSGVYRNKLPSVVPSASACMISKETRDPDYKKPEPWPYETKKYGFIQWHLYRTLDRIEENSKIVVVDGNIGSGKTAFAKELAEKFDLKYIPEPSMDSIYITPHGYDLRELDPIMPPTFKSCDINTFYKNPHDRNVTIFQYRMFVLRYLQYIDALAHLLNTGEGIVLDRSVYSDFVFMEAMHSAGYIGKEARQLYLDIYENCVPELMRPHLVIYLDISPEVALKRIKQRNNPVEVNSKVLTKDYLMDIEHFYKQHHLRKIEKHSELLIYDWSNFGDMEVVVEDIERIDLDRFTAYDEKMKDWRLLDDWEWGSKRMLYTNERRKLLQYAEISRYSVTEVFHPAEETREYTEIIEKVPGMGYDVGFDPNQGDNVLFKIYNWGYRDKIALFSPRLH